MARNSKLKCDAPVEFQRQWKKMAVRKQRNQRPPVDKEKFHGYCHYCHNFGHKVADCKVREENQSMKRKQDTNAEHGKEQVNSTPPEKVWMKELEA